MTAKKSEWIEYPCNYGYYKYNQKFEGTDIQIPQKFASLTTLRVHKETGAIQKRDSQTMYFSSSVKATIAELQEYENSHDEAIIEQDTEYGEFGDRDRDVVYLHGWCSIANQAELARAKEFIEAFKAAIAKTKTIAKENAEKAQQAALEAARKLLREQGEL